MTLTRKDAVATALTILVVLTFLAAYQGWGVPLVGDSPRWAAGVIMLLGAATCSLGAPSSGHGITTTLCAALGAAALVLTVLVLVTGSLTLLSLLAVDTVVLWAIATTRHALRVPQEPVPA